MKYKHKVQVEVEVETGNPEMPLHSELAQALYQKRKDPLLIDGARVVDTQIIEDKLEYFFEEKVRFGGHKIATSLSIPLPIQTRHVTPMTLHYYNEGTEKECHLGFRRRFKTKVEAGGFKTLTFKLENTEFTVIISNEKVEEPVKFTFDTKT